MGLVSISEVAKKYDKTVSQIKYAVQQQRLPGTKLGWYWFCEEESLPTEWPTTEQEQKRMGRKNC